MITELQLDRAFADKLSSSIEFQTWVLERTEFKDRCHGAYLLAKEQATAKPRKKPENWWRHWWCRLDDGSESETDIFAVFQFIAPDIRVALHIEDKPPHGKFTPNQYLNYKKRAAFMSGKKEYMDYSEFRTILLAPQSFIEGNLEKVKNFDHTISYEDVAQYIPLFGQSVDEAKKDAPKTAPQS